MADFNKRGPGCDDDCDGEGGERGKRGKRGHRGHDGRDGRDGAIGPTGPAAGSGLVLDPTPPTFTGNGTDESPLQVINVAPQPFTESDENRIIFANADGSDEDGDGTEGNPYLTLQHAVLQVPLFIPTGVFYYVDVTGLGQEELPDGYELPQWKAPIGYIRDFSNPTFVVKAAVNITAEPQLASNIPEADAVLTDADIVPTELGGGIVNVVPNPVGQSGTGDSFTLLGDDLVRIDDAAVTFDSRARSITISGATNPSNNGTFPVEGLNFSDNALVFINPAAVAEVSGFSWETYWYEEPVIEIETALPHGLWRTGEDPLQEVMIDGVTGTIGAVVNGTFVVKWVSPTKFAIFVDGTGLTYGGGGTVSVWFVQDEVSGNVQVKTNKTWPVDVLVGKLFIDPDIEFFNAVIYANTADTLYLTHSFAPPVFPGASFRVSEQSAELLTTFTGDGPGRGGFTAANIDSLALDGIKLTPVNPGERSLCQFGGSVVLQGCHITTALIAGATLDAPNYWSYLEDLNYVNASIDGSRNLYNLCPQWSPSDYVFLYFGVVLEATSLNYETATLTEVFATKIRNSPEFAILIQGGGKHTYNDVSIEDCALGVGGTGGAARNRLRSVNGNITPGEPILIAVNRAFFLVNSGPDDASFSNPGDTMLVGELPIRTFADFRAGIAGPRGQYTDITNVDPVEGATGTLACVLAYTL